MDFVCFLLNTFVSFCVFYVAFVNNLCPSGDEKGMGHSTISICINNIFDVFVCVCVLMSFLDSESGFFFL